MNDADSRKGDSPCLPFLRIINKNLLKWSSGFQRLSLVVSSREKTSELIGRFECRRVTTVGVFVVFFSAFKREPDRENANRGEAYIDSIRTTGYEIV